MNITKENIDDLNAVLRIQVDKTDYEENVEKVLKDYRKKANIKGFRPGMVPIGLVRKMYGRAVQIDEINKLVTENVQKYLTDEKIEILGDPLPKMDENDKIDFETQESFTFSFDLGLAPSIEIKLNKKNKVSYYEIAADEKMKNDYLENYTRRYGHFHNADTSEEKDMLKGRIEVLDEDGNPKEGGLFADDTTLGIDIIKDKKIRKHFIGKAPGDAIDFDLRKAFPNDLEIAGLLKLKKEEGAAIDGNFRFTIREISRFHAAEIGQELFDRIYGEGIVTSEEEFRKRLEDEITTNLKQESDYKLSLDLKKIALDKVDFQLPEEFLKRWLLKVNEKTTKEQIEQEFDSFRKDLKWQLVRNSIARLNEIKISEEELLKEAENVTRYQFRQYGLYQATDEQVTNYAKETIKREEDAKKIADKILEEKVIALIKDMVKLETKAVTVEEFNKLFEQ
ncbi:MAG: trigger factor [Bacteroidales bacterium]